MATFLKIEREYIVGFKDESKYNHFNNKMKHYTIKDEENYRKIIRNRKKTGIKTLDFRIPNPIDLNIKIRDILEGDKQNDYYYYGKDSRYFELLNSNIVSKETVYQLRRTYVRENKSNVCPTLTANMGTGGHNVPLIKDNFGIRKLIPRECLRLQGFEDDFILPDIARSHLYKQIGNSVTINVVERIANEMMKVMEDADYVFNIAK